MASRMKKMFHRKKDEHNEEPQQRIRGPATASSDPAMRTSLYESTIAGALPQSGHHPIKGNDSSAMLQAGRKSSTRSLRSRRSSSRGSHYDDARAAAARAPPQASYAGDSRSYNLYQDPSVSTGSQSDRRKSWSRSPLPQEFANLSLGNPHPPTTTVTQTVTTTRTGHQGQITNQTIPLNQNNAHYNDASKSRTHHTEALLQAPPANRGDFQNEVYYNTGDVCARATHVPHGQQHSTPVPQRDKILPDSRFDAYDTPTRQGEHDSVLARQKSIPRKQVGTSAHGSYPSTESPIAISSQVGHKRQQSASQVLPFMPARKGQETPWAEAISPPVSILDRSRPITRGSTKPRVAEDVINRAKSNSYDTQVVEKVAPAVVHENVTQDVHHIREEVVTREIHNHDVFHRILPVVDVEVLPPRHFLPVEGGGLVEVSASEVPGRGQNWVIAETASKIPSDQAAPQGHRRFTAREFPGTEGDTVSYVTPEGHEKTEQTWVHPPELEQGARLTGQSWPIVFGDETGGKETNGSPTPKSAKRKSPKKGSAIQASAVQRAAGIGRSP